jgi:hypothetical protein
LVNINQFYSVLYILLKMDSTVRPINSQSGDQVTGAPANLEVPESSHKEDQDDVQSSSSENGYMKKDSGLYDRNINSTSILDDLLLSSYAGSQAPHGNSIVSKDSRNRSLRV